MICVGGTMLVGLYWWNGFGEKVLVEQCWGNWYGVGGRVSFTKYLDHIHISSSWVYMQISLNH